MSKIFYVDTSFEPSDKNPFDDNKPYDSNWIMFKLVDDPNIYRSTGKGKNKLFQEIISKKCEGWQYRIMDFINYERVQDRNIIISVDEYDLNEAKRIYKGHNYTDKKLRYYEPKVLIHSTPLNCWESVKSSNCLKAWNILKQENIITNEMPIGSLLGDPEDFSNYIMLGLGINCEIVVSSKQKNKIEMDMDALYEPGVRLYFDAKKIANDGLLTRDGVHYKVKDTLLLNKYLIWSATIENINMKDHEITPRNFACCADEAFEKRFGISLKKLK